MKKQETIDPEKMLFTKPSEAIQAAKKRWHDSEGDYEVRKQLEKVIEDEGDVYAALSLHIFMHDNFLRNKKAFCKIVDGLLGITDSEERLDETMKLVESDYVDERFNSAFYLLIDHEDMTFEAADSIMEKIATKMLF